MSDGIVQVAVDSTGKKIDCDELTVNSQTVERQRGTIADPTVAAAIARVVNASPTSEYGLVTRNIPSGTQTIQGVQDAATTGSIVAATTVVGPLAISSRNVITVSIHGTYAGVVFIIEASDDGGTTYYPLMCMDNKTGQAGSTWTPGTNGVASYDAAVGGYTHIRVRATAWTSGTGLVSITGQAFAYEPAVAALSQGLGAVAAVPVGFPVYTAFWDGTNVRVPLLNTSGHLNVIFPSAQAVTNTPATPTATTLNSAATTNTGYAKASAGTLYGIACSNVSASVRYLKLYNKASAPTLASDTPVLVIPIAAASVANFQLGPLGLRFSTGIAYAITGGVADTDTTAIALGDCKMFLSYI